MIQAINNNATTNNALYNKGVGHGVSTFESLNTERKIIEKKIANYLVVPNICILSL
jgi:putative SET domain-containing protein L678